MPEKLKVKLAVYLVLRDEDKILLLKRQNTGYMDGYYSLVAGHVEENESVQQAIAREAKEEAKIIIEEDDLEVLLVQHYVKDNYMGIFLSPKKYTGTITNMEPDKCTELAFYSINDLPDNMIPEVKAALKTIQQDIKYSNYY